MIGEIRQFQYISFRPYCTLYVGCCKLDFQNIGQLHFTIFRVMQLHISLFVL